ncbi:hypothetical protein F4782DRAFT_533256 [Xylaria castorea]|nr:hypothetical protein F4782DRAFT_533256 [Xylaria castorea]
MRCFHQPFLPPEFFTTSSCHIRDHLLEYPNVHAVVYFDLFNGAYQPGSGFKDRKLGRYIFRKWFHWHNGRPPFLGHQRLAKAVGLKGGESRDIQGIRKFHRSHCDAVSTGLNQQELLEPIRSTNRSVILSHPKNLRDYKDQSREMAHLFQAIVIIVDDQVVQHKEPEICRPVLPPESKERDLLVHLEKERDWTVSQYSVLILFKTGDDVYLSSPISFQSLYDLGKAFAVKRPDYDRVSRVDRISLVRVRLDTALEFNLNLIFRQCETIPFVELAAETKNKQYFKACKKWVDDIIAHAGKVGIDTNSFTWEAVHRTKAT